MITITNTHTWGFEGAVRGMRNPLNSWDKIDSGWGIDGEDEDVFVLGDNDKALMKKLRNSGPDHGKFMRMIHVQADICAPLYWWKEYDTYKVGTVANSCSTMHKIAAKEFTEEDFSCDKLEEDLACVQFVDQESGAGVAFSSKQILEMTIFALNFYRGRYNETKDKSYWWQMIQLLPSSYNQLRTVDLNYEVLKNIYHARKDHKLDEWHAFCDWVKELPYSRLIVGDEE